MNHLLVKRLQKYFKSPDWPGFKVMTQFESFAILLTNIRNADDTDLTDKSGSEQRKSAQSALSAFLFFKLSHYGFSAIPCFVFQDRSFEKTVTGITDQDGDRRYRYRSGQFGGP